MCRGNTVPLVGGRHPILLECNVVVSFLFSVCPGKYRKRLGAFFGILHYVSFMAIFCFLQRLIFAEVEFTMMRS